VLNHDKDNPQLSALNDMCYSGMVLNLSFRL